MTRIGEVVAGEGVEIRLPGGRTLEPGGFDQLGLSAGGSSPSSSRTPRRLSIASATSAGLGR